LRGPGQDLLEKERARRGKLSRKILDLHPGNGEEDVGPIQSSERMLRMHEAGSEKRPERPPPSSEGPVKRRARDEDNDAMREIARSFLRQGDGEADDKKDVA